MVWVSGFPLLVWRVDEFGDIGRTAQQGPRECRQKTRFHVRKHVKPWFHHLIRGRASSTSGGMQLEPPEEAIHKPPSTETSCRAFETRSNATINRMNTQNTQTPAFNRLNKAQQIFLLALEDTGDHIHAARVAKYPVSRASVVLKSPRIRAAIAERRPVVAVQGTANASDVMAGLLIEAQESKNTGAARVQAWKSLADILGMTGGGGSREDGALSTFIRGIGAAVASGAFAGVSAAVSANAPVPPLPASPSPVVAAARVVPAARVLDNPLPF
mgnify:FL=1